MQKLFNVALVLGLCVLVPAVGGAVYCGFADRTFCQLNDICRNVLDQYPDSEITEKGKDCTLTVENRQLIIRRKRVDGKTGYFWYKRVTPYADEGKPGMPEENIQGAAEFAAGEQ